MGRVIIYTPHQGFGMWGMYYMLTRTKDFIGKHEQKRPLAQY
jgi:hypothetical protein